MSRTVDPGRRQQVAPRRGPICNLLGGGELPALWPLPVAAALWSALFVAVAPRRFGREEFS